MNRHETKTSNAARTKTLARTHTEITVTTSFDKLKEREAKVICPTYGRYPLAVAKSQGKYLFDLDGNKYLDLLSGIAVASIGHARPELAQVMVEQAHKLTHVSNLFYQEEHVLLAEKLLATCPDTHQGGKVFFCNSGAEANEAAIKLARRFMRTVKNRDAFEIITLVNSFHGRTLATLAATGQDALKEHFEPLPQGFTSVPWNDLAAMEAAITPQTAAILVEMVQGEGGVLPMEPAYAQGIQKLCRDHDILLMVDEVQTGMCRTGKHWAFQHYGLAPDVFTSAKALAGGLPMGAMIATETAAKGFAPGAHATTFGGGPILSAVACKVLDIMRDEKLCEHAAQLGDYALDQFRRLQAKHPDKIGQVRGLGLMLGIELTVDKPADIWRALLDAGFILNLAHGTVLRLVPPLIIDEADIDAFTKALDGILKD